MTSYNESHIPSILSLLLADSSASLRLGLSLLDKLEPIPDLFFRALTMTAYLGKKYRPSHEEEAHQFLVDHLSEDKVKSLQDEILLFDYARFRFRPSGTWHMPNSPFRMIQQQYEAHHDDYFYIASFKPEYYASLYALVAARLKEDKEYTKEAIRYYQYAISLHPSHPILSYTTHLIRIKYAYLTKEPLPPINTVIEQINPFQLPNLNAKSITIACNILSDLEAFPTAIEWYKEGIKRFPNEPSLLNNLAYLHAKYLNDFETAKELADSYEQQFSGDTSFFDTLAFIKLHGFQQLRESERLYKKCLLLDRKSHFAHTGLGDILFIKQNYEEAFSHYLKGLWKDDQFTTRRKREIIEKIEKIISCLKQMPETYSIELRKYQKKLKKLTQ